MPDSLIVDLGTEIVTPLGDRVLVLPDKWQETTKGGIVLPDTVKTRSQRGTVVAIGPDVKGIAVGERVLCTFWSAVHLDINDEEHFLYGEKDILGVLTGEAPGASR